MADLIAQGTEPEQRWRRPLSEQTSVLGRDAGAMSAPWDSHISRRHAELAWQGGLLEVRKLEEARNPIYFRGRPEERFLARPGEHFVIGGTTFTVADEKVQVTREGPRPLEEKTYSPGFLQRVRYRNADQRIDVLSRLPEVIRGASDDRELLVRLANILLAGLARADSVAIVECSGAPDFEVRVLHWDRRRVSTEAFAPSQRLIRQAVERGESVVHVWSSSHSARAAQYTESENVDWAFCTPVMGGIGAGAAAERPSERRQGERRGSERRTTATGDTRVGERRLGPHWAIYVAGKFAGGLGDLAGGSSDPRDLRDDLKFAELAASTLGGLRELRQLERRSAGLSQFFSPVVLQSLEAADPEAALTPRECDVSVMFCDLRGFSRRSEQLANDLLGLLERVSRALGVMTSQILEQGGVVGDFHGDAAMGFWGWPLPQPDAVQRAARAALGIRAVFLRAAREAGNPLSDFRLGIGIGTGRAVAGKIGTIDQVKATVFGPVVNLASRLEGMTKMLRAGILLDEVSARILRETSPPGGVRLRRVARVLPYGMTTPLEVSELLPPEAECPELTDQDVARYEQALDALLVGDWQAAFEWLHQVPASDRVKDFLTVLIAQHNRTPPDGWDGVIKLGQK